MRCNPSSVFLIFHNLNNTGNGIQFLYFLLGELNLKLFFKRKNYLAKKEIPHKNINAVAIIAWAAGVAVANFVNWGITAINGMIVAVLVYTVLVDAVKLHKWLEKQDI